jgi:hypothetical protein
MGFQKSQDFYQNPWFAESHLHQQIFVSILALMMDGVGC